MIYNTLALQLIGKNYECCKYQQHLSTPNPIPSLLPPESLPPENPSLLSLLLSSLPESRAARYQLACTLADECQLHPRQLQAARPTPISSISFTCKYLLITLSCVGVLLWAMLCSHAFLYLMVSSCEGFVVGSFLVILHKCLFCDGLCLLVVANRVTPLL